MAHRPERNYRRGPRLSKTSCPWVLVDGPLRVPGYVLRVTAGDLKCREYNADAVVIYAGCTFRHARTGAIVAFAAEWEAT